jgi:hypothetical protein
MIVDSFVQGIKRTVSAPAILLGVFLLTTGMAVPLAIALRATLGTHIGSSLAAYEAADAVNHDWWQEFQAQASGLASTFTPSVVGFAAVLENLSGVLDGEAPIAPLAGVLGAYIAAWTFLSGGIIDRLARQRPTRAHGFFAASGVFFLRFLRLAAVAGLLYWVLFAVIHEWLLEDAYRRATQDLASERAAFAWRVVLYIAFGALLVVANVLFDYAKVRAVVEDRRSMLLALAAAARFVYRNRARVFGLYAANAVLFVALVGLWAMLAPGAGGAGLSMWLGFVLAQVYIVARLFLKLQFIASQTALFQATLAHASYVAAPVPAWPESPSAELIHAGR